MAEEITSLKLKIEVQCIDRASKQKTRRVFSISSDKRFAYKQKRMRIEGN